MFEGTYRGVSLRQKLMAVMTIPGVVLIVATGFAYTASERRAESTDQITRTYRILTELESVIADLSSAESGLRGYLITGDDDMLDPYRRSRDEVSQNLREMEDLIRDPEAAGYAKTLSDEVRRRVGELEAFAATVSSGVTVSKDDIEFLAKQGALAMDDVLRVGEQLRTRELELLATRSARLDRAEDVSSFIRMIGLPGGLIAAGLLVALFAGRLLKRIDSLSENTRRLEKGLPLLDSSRHRDELGELERTFVKTGTKVIELRGELQRLATIDPLTGLSNRRGFLDTAEHRLDLSRQQHAELALVFVDADGLKNVNDTLGHSMGDELLQEIGALLRDTFRTSDLPARLGGDEFCVLVTADSIAGIDVARTRLCEAIAMANRLPGRLYDVSVSLGIAVFDKEHDRSIEDLIARADALMYEEKRGKREMPDPSQAPVVSPLEDTRGAEDGAGNDPKVVPQSW